MDKTVLVNKLREIFSSMNFSGKRYSRIWLNDVDYGGLYYSGKYDLFAIANKGILEYSPEMHNLIDLLDEKLSKEEFSYIDGVLVYLENQRAPIKKDDIIIYSAQEPAYNTAA